MPRGDGYIAYAIGMKPIFRSILVLRDRHGGKTNKDAQCNAIRHTINIFNLIAVVEEKYRVPATTLPIEVARHAQSEMYLALLSQCFSDMLVGNVDKEDNLFFEIHINVHVSPETDYNPVVHVYIPDIHNFTGSARGASRLLEEMLKHMNSC